MTQLKHALIDLVYNDETGRYIGMLERKMFKLEMDNIKLRALLELLTDEDWDDYSFKDEDDEIRKLATSALERRLGMTSADARKEVNRRFKSHNPEPATVDTSTYLIGPPQDGPSTTTAISVDTPMPYDVRKHLAGLEQAAKNRDAMRDQL